MPKSYVDTLEDLRQIAVTHSQTGIASQIDGVKSSATFASFNPNVEVAVPASSLTSFTVEEV